VLFLNDNLGDLQRPLGNLLSLVSGIVLGDLQRPLGDLLSLVSDIVLVKMVHVHHSQKVNNLQINVSLLTGPFEVLKKLKP
jgi:hypothetical protein